jgi:hypothetical protein
MLLLAVEVAVDGARSKSVADATRLTTVRTVNNSSDGDRDAVA